ncbi:hypothetical protein G9A89_009619 [Geosiphon pyriformis]|nr:hypothetical protein G9A89_009619 [Geosiphon pyriformis]
MANITHSPPRIDKSLYERASTFALLEPLRQKLVNDLSQIHAEIAAVSSRELSSFLGDFLEFQQVVLGIDPSHTSLPRPVKIPPKLFKLDPAPSPSSAVYYILFAAYQYRGQNGWRSWDWTRTDKMVELVSYVRRELIQRNIIKNPVISFEESVNVNTRQELRQIVISLGGQLADNKNSPTHIINGTNDGIDDTELDYFRTLEKKNGKVFIHWWYYPDSYDTWVQEAPEHADPEPAPEHNGHWNVGVRWLRDSLKFNEWMNEEDYEISEERRLSAEEDQSFLREMESSAMNKRNLDYSNSPLNMDIDTQNNTAKRLRTETPDPDPDPVPEHHRLSVVNIESQLSRPGARNKKNEFEPLSNTDIVNISEAYPPILNKLEETKSTSKEQTAFSNAPIEMDSLATDLSEIHIPAENRNNMDIDTSYQDQKEIVDEMTEETPHAPKDEDEPEHKESPGEPRASEEPSNDNVISENINNVDTEAIAAHAEEEKKRIEEEARKYLSAQTQEVIIPSYAAWFDMAKIHEIEKKALPEFFNNKNKSKTPSIYKDYRDFILNTYRLNPSEYLTVTACRRNLAGDVCAIIRVHAFLEQWGLINYQVDPETRPSTIGPPFTGHYRITADTPRGLQPFQPSAAPPTTLNSQALQVSASTSAATTTSAKVELNLGLRQYIYQSDAKSTPQEISQENGNNSVDNSLSGSKRPYNCFTCGADCTRARYHNVKTKNFELCPNCYLDGRFPSTMYSGDFVKMCETPFNHAQDNDWTDEEVLRLLEALEMFDEDWNQIADHVGTRTREQCILHFMQLPIEDPYLGTPISNLGPLQYHRLPFSQADNPIMSVVAFLASVVNPGVAAAVAKSSLQEMSMLKKNRDVIKDKNGVNGAKIGDNLSTNDPNTPTVEVKQEDTMDTEVTNQSSSTDQGTLSPRSVMEKAGAAALGAAAAKAKALADYEEREIQRLVNTVIESQLKKLELKLQQFEEMESILEVEKRELENQRNQLYIERLTLKKNLLLVQEQLKTAQATGTINVPVTGYSYANASNTMILSASEYHEEQDQNYPEIPLSQEAPENIVMNSF